MIQYFSLNFSKKWKLGYATNFTIFKKNLDDKLWFLKVISTIFLCENDVTLITIYHIRYCEIRKMFGFKHVWSYIF